MSGAGSRDPGRPESEPTRARIVAAAFALFADRGYEGTTIDAVAERAGIARRTFFRYFKSKDDVIFPDHDALLALVRQYLEVGPGQDPVAAVCGGIRLVFRSYVGDAEVAVQRYLLSRTVPALRQREGASVSVYERAFAGYLRERWPTGAGDRPTPGGGHDATGAATGGLSPGLWAAVTAAALVAAHNTVLRQWLRDGGTTPLERAVTELDDALDSVVRLLAPAGGLRDPGGHPSHSGHGAHGGHQVRDEAAAAVGPQTVVAVFRANGSVDHVVNRLRQELGDLEAPAG